AALATRQARRLEEERDGAVTARGEADGQKRRAEEALGRAKEQETRAETARGEAEDERRIAQEERDKAKSALEFLTKDMIGAADPAVLGHEPTMVEILRAAAARVSQRFGSTPAVEDSVRAMLADSFHALGHYTDAEAVIRPAVERGRADPTTNSVVLGKSEHRL